MALQGLSELLQVSLSLEALSAPLRGSPRPWPGIINKLGYLDSVWVWFYSAAGRRLAFDFSSAKRFKGNSCVGPELQDLPQLSDEGLSVFSFLCPSPGGNSLCWQLLSLRDVCSSGSRHRAHQQGYTVMRLVLFFYYYYFFCFVKWHIGRFTWPIMGFLQQSADILFQGGGTVLS